MCKKGLYPQKKFNSRYSTIYYRKSMKMAVRKSIIMLFRYQSLLVFSVKQAFKVHVQCMYLITSKVRILKEYFSFSRNLCTKMSCPTPLLQYQSCSANIFCCQIFVWKCTTSESLKLQFSWGSMPHTPLDGRVPIHPFLFQQIPVLSPIGNFSERCTAFTDYSILHTQNFKDYSANRPILV